ncbi:MAG: 4Fe-4S binding protein [Dehalococcoidia bacterium]|jgi:2-oxoacid:acceptor oxidoreductase delta subunit (pyruvate/2-ketoisovalerate family)|nr:4Fe-4S binding protein [Dehalococcoidia bacterium]
MTYKVKATVSRPSTTKMGKTGSWRDFRPVIDASKCIKCLRCWISCPDACIKRAEDDSVSISYDYCKGCGVCANECPAKAITMTREGLDQ